MHEITSSDGMFTVRQSAWHGLGTVFTDYPSRKEAQSLAHPWEPEGQPIYRRHANVGPDGVEYESFEEIGGYRVNVRTDNDFELGVVTDTYTNVLNNEIWDVAEALEKSGSDVMFETAGSLGGGKQVWVLVRLKDPLVVKGDPRGETIPYFALQNSHDGTGAFRGQATVTRIVCANTARIADMDSQARGTEFLFRHSKNVGERIEQARGALSGWRTQLGQWQEQTEKLVATKIEPLTAGKFLEKFIMMPPESTISEKVKANIEADRAKWLEHFNGFTGEGLRDNAYGLVQASIEFANWSRRAFNAESLFRRTFLTSDKLIQRAVELAMQAGHEN